jgi:hypothetical protein
MSSLKAELIPDESRAAVMSLLRVPMNIGVCAILWQVSQIGLDNEKNVGITMLTLNRFRLILFP